MYLQLAIRRHVTRSNRESQLQYRNLSLRILIKIEQSSKVEIFLCRIITRVYKTGKI